MDLVAKKAGLHIVLDFPSTFAFWNDDANCEGKLTVSILCKFEIFVPYTYILGGGGTYENRHSTFSIEDLTTSSGKF